MKIAAYDTCLTDAQWAFVKPMLPQPSKRGRPPTDRRPIINAILYILKGGIPWRLLPAHFPPWKTVCHIFRQWSRDHPWRALHDRLRALERPAHGQRCRPTAAMLDSQSVKSDPHGGAVGCDAAKNIKGRKRHLLVDTLGLVLGVLGHPRQHARTRWRPSPASTRLGLVRLAAPVVGGRRLQRRRVCAMGQRVAPQAESGGGQTRGCGQGI